jgi:hypothetical protein
VAVAASALVVLVAQAVADEVAAVTLMVLLQRHILVLAVVVQRGLQAHGVHTVQRVDEELMEW